MPAPGAQDVPAAEHGVATDAAGAARAMAEGTEAGPAAMAAAGQAMEAMGHGRRGRQSELSAEPLRPGAAARLGLGLPAWQPAPGICPGTPGAQPVLPVCLAVEQLIGHVIEGVLGDGGLHAFGSSDESGSGASDDEMEDYGDGDHSGGALHLQVPADASAFRRRARAAPATGRGRARQQQAAAWAWRSGWFGCLK